MSFKWDYDPLIEVKNGELFLTVVKPILKMSCNNSSAHLNLNYTIMTRFNHKDKIHCQLKKKSWPPPLLKALLDMQIIIYTY